MKFSPDRIRDVLDAVYSATQTPTLTRQERQVLERVAGDLGRAYRLRPLESTPLPVESIGMGDQAMDGLSRFGLSEREREVARLAARGLQNAEIGTILNTSPLTVRNQISSVFRKMNVSTRAELAFTVASLESGE